MYCLDFQSARKFFYQNRSRDKFKGLGKANDDVEDMEGIFAGDACTLDIFYQCDYCSKKTLQGGS